MNKTLIEFSAKKRNNNEKKIDETQHSNLSSFRSKTNYMRTKNFITLTTNSQEKLKNEEHKS